MEELYLVCKKCGLINSFEIRENGKHHTAFCTCGAYIKHIAHDTPKLYFGKYKGTAIAEINDIEYLKWVIKEVHTLSKNGRDNVIEQIKKLEYGKTN